MAEKANHITILCSRLNLAGGIERAVVNTANLFAKKGYSTTLLILDDTNTSFYPIHPSVRIIQAPLSFGITAEGNPVTRKIRLLSDVLKLRRTLKQLKPDVVIASEYPFACAAVLCGQQKRSRLFSWEHHHYHELKRNNFWERVFKNTYPRLHGVICLNPDEQKLFSQVNSRTTIIPNFIERSALAPNHPNIILTIARLTAVKGIDKLLEVAKQVLPAHPAWQWKLIGEGEMKDQILQFAKKEGLTKQFLLQSPLDHDIIDEYKEAGLYVMTSVNECFPMTLLEAQSVGLPCIAFDCETGPRHIIKHQQDGILVEKNNVSGMVAAITTLIENNALREEMGKKAHDDIERFSSENIFLLWKNLVDSNR